MTNIFRLSFKNFTTHVSRYKFLILILTLSSLLVTMLIGVFAGMTDTLRMKSAQYFSGDLAVLAYRPWGNSYIHHPDIVLDTIDDLDLANKAIAVRSVYYKTNSILFFNGNEVGQRRIIGINWEAERDVLSNLDIVAGNLPEPNDPEAVLISENSAKSLGAVVGDRITLNLETYLGQSNTVQLIIHGVYKEASFFGYVSYMHHETLNLAQARNKERVNEIGIFLEDRSQQNYVRDLLHEKLSERVDNIGPIIDNKDELVEIISTEDWEGHRYFVTTLDASLDELKDLIDALTILAFFLVLIFLGIVVIGISNTFAMIVYERTRQIGVMRALGMTRLKVVLSYLIEAGLIGFSGIFLGLILGFLGLHIVGNLDLSAVSVASLFLINGRIQWTMPPAFLFLTVFIVFLSSMLGSLKSSIKAAYQRPVDSLRAD